MKNDICLQGVPLEVDDNTEKIPKNVSIFSASKLNQISSGYAEAKHGIFSYFLMKGLEGNADLNGDKKIKNKLATITDFVDNKYIVSVDGEEDLRDISLDGNNLRSLVSGQSLDKHKDGKPSNIQEMDGEIYHIEEVEMSPFVFEAYGKIRKLENKMDMKNTIKAGLALEFFSASFMTTVLRYKNRIGFGTRFGERAS